MKNIKRIIAVLLMAISLLSVFPVSSYAATTRYKTMSNGLTAYRSSKTVMYNQTHVEKAITIKKNTTKTVTPKLSIGSSCDKNLRSYVNFLYGCMIVRTGNGS